MDFLQLIWLKAEFCIDLIPYKRLKEKTTIPEIVSPPKLYKNDELIAPKS